MKTPYRVGGVAIAVSVSVLVTGCGGSSAKDSYELAAARASGACWVAQQEVYDAQTLLSGQYVPARFPAADFVANFQRAAELGEAAIEAVEHSRRDADKQARERPEWDVTLTELERKVDWVKRAGGAAQSESGYGAFLAGGPAGTLPRGTPPSGLEACYGLGLDPAAGR